MPLSLQQQHEHGEQEEEQHGEQRSELTQRTTFKDSVTAENPGTSELTLRQHAVCHDCKRVSLSAEGVKRSGCLIVIDLNWTLSSFVVLYVHKNHKERIWYGKPSRRTTTSTSHSS